MGLLKSEQKAVKVLCIQCSLCNHIKLGNGISSNALQNRDIWRGDKTSKSCAKVAEDL